MNNASSTVPQPMRRLFAYLRPYYRQLNYAIASSVANKVLDLMPPLLVGWVIDTVRGDAPGWITSILQKGNIDPGLKRLIGYICSTATGCQYCTAHTNYTARFYQIDEEKMKNVWNFESSDLFTPSEKAALQLAKASSEQPNGATEKDFDLLRQFYTKNEIVEIVFTISLYAFLNKFNSTMNTELEDAPRELLEKMITQ